jgi:dipeptidyl aminopeptidase/acylaminoacyl peptidase
MKLPLTRRYLLNLSLYAAALVAVAAVFLVGSFSYLGAATYTHPARRPAATTPAAVGLPYEELRLLTEDGLRIAAWYVPSANRAAVILLHGTGGNRGGGLGLGRDLAARGYGLLMLDLRAHGESDGAVSTMGLLEVRDVRAAAAYLQSRPEVDAARIAVYGASLGAAVAIMAAAEIPELRAVVADSSFASVEWLAGNQFGSLLSLPPWMASTVVLWGSLQTGLDATQMAPAARVGRINPRPLMIIHGEQDDVFKVENARLLARAAGEPKEVWIVPGVGHTAAYATDPAGYASRVGTFLEEAMKNAE